MEPSVRKKTKSQTAKEKQDISIMATNNSSVVSKRSVEKLYYREEPGYFRPFVKKFQRRSPLINRGYFLRMRAIENVVKTFLEEHLGLKTAVVNLGCGYDPLPFRFLDRLSNISRYSTFIDVDYAQLMAQKCQIVKQNDILNYNLKEIVLSPDDDRVLLKSQQYYAVACDLYDLDRLDSLIKNLHGPHDGPILFVAEVSMTYMGVDGADSLIKWASSFETAQFCLLEQFLPAGQDHPFAATMLKHFQKLQSPLNSINVYPDLPSQVMRFEERGWSSVNVKSLWNLWSDDSVITPDERRLIDSLEPFDEWEEFGLFSGHYFLLNALTHTQVSSLNEIQAAPVPEIQSTVGNGPGPLVLHFAENPNSQGRRRYGAGFSVDKNTVACHGGLGTRCRLADSDIYTKNIANKNIRIPSRPLMCHTISRIKNDDFSLVGGRASPSEVSRVHIYGQGTSWAENADSPVQSWRHCATPVEFSSHTGRKVHSLLIFGGKNSKDILDGWFLYENNVRNTESNDSHRARGVWRTVKAIGDIPNARFGAAIALHVHSTSSGYLIGGIGNDHVVLNDFYEWEIGFTDEVTVICRRLSLSLKTDFGRFGATLVSSEWGTLLVGGISCSGVLHRKDEILVLTNHSLQRLDYRVVGPRPLLIGCAIVTPSPKELLIVGGGAVCFSFGTFWNDGSFYMSSHPNMSNPWKLLDPVKHNAGSFGTNKSVLPRIAQSTSRRSIQTSHEFECLVTSSNPDILDGLDLGLCTKLWDLDYLRKSIGEDSRVIVHKASSTRMSFLEKNFTYENMSFGSFLNQVQDGSKVYMRSVSSEKPAERPTSLREDFPTIADDFRIPTVLSLVSENVHSSPLRISGPVQMWLHYDVMANVLCQIHGSKKVMLFPPTDIDKLRFPAGASSSPLDVFQGNEEVRAVLAATHPQEAMLQPGDVLFIPALWAHAATPTEGHSISVNVFFRSLSKGYAAGKDVYGNRDLQGYENGRRDIQKIGKAFQGLPPSVGTFYLKRLASELQEMADTWD